MRALWKQELHSSPQKRRYFSRFLEHEAEVDRETRATEEDACLKNAKKIAPVLRATMKFLFPQRSHFLSGSWKFIAILSYGFVVEVASKNHLTVCFLRKRVATWSFGARERNVVVITSWQRAFLDDWRKISSHHCASFGRLRQVIYVLFSTRKHDFSESLPKISISMRVYERVNHWTAVMHPLGKGDDNGEVYFTCPASINYHQRDKERQPCNYKGSYHHCQSHCNADFSRERSRSSRAFSCLSHFVN